MFKRERTWKMKKNRKRVLLVGSGLVVAFAVLTVLIQIVDVQPIGQKFFSYLW